MVNTRAGVAATRPDNEPPPGSNIVSQALPDAPTSASIPSSLPQPDGTTSRSFPLANDVCHVLENVLKLAPDSDVHEAFYLAGVDHTRDLVMVSITTGPTDILTYVQTSSGVIHHASRYSKKVRKLIAYVHWNQNLGDPTTDYGAMTLTDFNAFRDDGRFKKITEDAMRTQGNYSQTPQVGPSTQLTPFVDDRTKNFSKGIKRDARAYKVISDDKQFDSWNRHTLATAKAQGVGEVLQKEYVPKTPGDIVLFQLKQEFLYPVLLEVLKTDVGQSLVRNSAYDGNAQIIYAKFCEHSATSTKAEQTASDLIKYITTFTIAMWKGSCHAFILHWLDQVRVYHTLVAAGDHLSYFIRLRFLRNAVDSNPALQAVETTGDILKQALRNVDVKGTPTTPKSDFDAYLVLLRSAAQKYDLQFTSRYRKQRQANVHQSDFDTHLSIDNEIPIQFADSPTQQSTLDVNLHRTIWDKLTPDAQARWDGFTSEEKELICRIEPRKFPANTTARTPTSTRPPGNRKANLHEISAADFIQAFSHAQSQGRYDHNNDSKQKEANQEPTRTVNFIGTDSEPTPNAVPDDDPDITNSGDFRNMLANYTKLHDQEYNVNVHKLAHYRVSGHKTLTFSDMTIVDRGSNGHVLGEGWRLIEHTTRTVGVTGFTRWIQNDIPICTAGAYCETSIGPTILIAHQSAFRRYGTSVLSSIQMEAHGISVDEKSAQAGGTQCITTPEGCIVNLNIREGLSYAQVREYTDAEYIGLPHIVLSSDTEWDPTIFDSKPLVNRDIIIKYMKEARIEQWYGTLYNFVHHWVTQVHIAEQLDRGEVELERELHERTATLDPDYEFEPFQSERQLFKHFCDSISVTDAFDKVASHTHIEKFTPDGEKYHVLRALDFYEYHDAIAKECTKIDNKLRTFPHEFTCADQQHFQYDAFNTNTDVREVITHMKSISIHNDYQDPLASDPDRDQRDSYYDKRNEAYEEQLEEMESRLKYRDGPPRYDYSSDPIISKTRLYRSMIDRHGQGSVILHKCNRGIAGNDVLVIHRTGNTADVTNVMGTYVPGLEICTVAALANTLQGPAILIMHEYAYAGYGKTIHSCNQIADGCPEDEFDGWGVGNINVRIEIPKRRKHNKWAGRYANDRSSLGYQRQYVSDYPGDSEPIPTCLRTTSSHDEDVDIILKIKDARPHINMRQYTEYERRDCEHRIVYLTSGKPLHTNDLVNMIVAHASERGRSLQDPKINLWETMKPHGENTTTTDDVTNPHGENDTTKPKAVPTTHRNKRHRHHAIQQTPTSKANPDDKPP